MYTRANRRLRAFAFAIAGGVFVALVLFLLTSQTPPYQYVGGPGIHVISGPGFDVLSGRPHGGTIEYDKTPFSPAVAPHTEDVPVELLQRRAIPVPVGFAVGAAAALVILVLTNPTRSRRAQATA